jgi:selenocysteine lyase/cysteine desulfurase
LVAHLLGVEPDTVREQLARVLSGEEIQMPGAVRASVGLGTTTSDVDELLTAVRVLAQGA